MAGFEGSGGPPPSTAREQGGGGQKPFGFRFYEDLPSGKKKKVGYLQIDKGEQNCPVLVLDEALAEGDLWQPSVLIHERFKFANNWQNYSLCRRQTPEGCSLDIALQQEHKHAHWCKEDCDRAGKMQPRGGAWRWVFTCIKLKPFTFTKGPLKGKTVPYHRCLGLAGEDQYKTFLTYRKAWPEGLRGHLFNVSRSEGDFSPRLGETWDPAELLSDEQMMERFADAAADYGLPPEAYIRPMDYDSILALPTTAQINEIAKWVAGERGVNLDQTVGETPEANPVAAAVGGGEAGGESPDTDVPF